MTLIASINDLDNHSKYVKKPVTDCIVSTSISISISLSVYVVCLFVCYCSSCSCSCFLPQPSPKKVQIFLILNKSANTTGGKKLVSFELFEKNFWCSALKVQYKRTIDSGALNLLLFFF